LPYAEDGVVDAQHHDGVDVVLGGDRQDHLAGAGGQVLLEVRLLREHPGGLHHEGDVEVLPGEGGRVLRRQGLDGLAVHPELPLAGLDGPGEAPVDRVVLEQAGEGGGVGEVVDRDDLELGAGVQGPEDQAADAAEAVDGDASGHGCLLSV